jgi:hypothetical protein
MPLNIKNLKRPRPPSDDGASAPILAPVAVPAPAAASGFGAAMAKILSRELHVAPSVGAVLAKRRTAGEKAMAAVAAETRARRTAAARRRARVAARNAQPGAATLDAERALRRVATKGVVALFNAISKHQRATEAALDESTGRTAAVAAVSGKQAGFLGLLQGATAAVAASGAGRGGGGVGGVGGAQWLRSDYATVAGTARGARTAALAAERHDEGVAAHMLDSDGGEEF